MIAPRDQNPVLRDARSTGHRDSGDSTVWAGDDEVDGVAIISLDGIDHPNSKIVGIEIRKTGPEGDSMLGYAPMTKASWDGAEPDEYEIDDIHVSLVKLCADYCIPLESVLDRMAVALVRAEAADVH